jgi:hypothetical protein
MIIILLISHQIGGLNLEEHAHSVIDAYQSRDLDRRLNLRNIDSSMNPRSEYDPTRWGLSSPTNIRADYDELYQRALLIPFDLSGSRSNRLLLLFTFSVNIKLYILVLTHLNVKQHFVKVSQRNAV